MRSWLSLALGSAFLLSACASGPGLIGGHVTVAEAGALPPPNTGDLASPSFSYVIAPYDRVAVEVYGAEALNRTVQADANGNISYPLIGEVAAAGLSPAQLARAMEQRLVGYVRNPQVLVSIVESERRVVTVDGEVREPGLYPVIGRMTLTQAVARAKGTTEFAELRHVVIFRTVDGQRMAALHDMRSIRRGLYEDPQIFPQDIVVVGDSQARRLFRSVVEAAGLITTPLIILLQQASNP